MKLFVSKCAEAVVLAARSRKLRYLAVLFLLLGVFGSQAWAQQGTIVGTVTDPSGAAVPNAAVTITNTNTGIVSQWTTNNDGQYVVTLVIGTYNIRVEASGFKAVDQKDVAVTVGMRERHDFQLVVGAVKESVIVEATPVAVQTDTGEISDLISGQQVTKIAMNGRTIYNLVALLPGVSSLMPDFQVPTPVAANANASFNGQRMVHNIYLLDGGEDLDRGGGGTMSVMPSAESIAEFRALSADYSAEYGLSSAGTMNMVLRSGTNKFHGEAWEFLRNDDLQAVTYFQTKKPELRMNIFGFNVGGPVSFHPSSGEHKTFFFYNMEWRRLIQGGSLLREVPPTSEYGGQFAAGVIHTPCTNQVDATVTAAFTAAGQTLSTPGGTGACTAAGGATLVPFTSNKIPTTLINPSAAALLTAGGTYGGIFPANNGVDPQGNPAFLGGNNSPTYVREETTRVDHRFNDKFSVFGHFIAEQIMQTYGTTMWSGDNVPSIGNTFGNPSYSGVVHTVNTISPSVVNEIAFNYNGNRIHILPIGLVSLPSGVTFPRLFPGPNDENRIPTINLGGSTGAQYSANWTPWNNKADDYQIRDDLSWTKGTHQIKIGASWALYKKVQDVFASTQGNYTFNGFFSGNDFADYLLGMASGYGEDAVHDFGLWNNISTAAYIQDNWRVNNRLTLNLGVRWDGIPHTYEAVNRYSDFYPSMFKAVSSTNFFNSDGTINKTGPGAAFFGSSPNPILAGVPFYLNGVGISGQAGVPHGMVNDSWWNFGPRLGFAYDLTGNGKTIVRSGFSMMYERIQGNDMYDGGTDVPFSASYGATAPVFLAHPATDVKTGTTISVANLPALVVGFTGLDQNNYKPPRTFQFSAGIQRELAPKSVLSVSYVGVRSDRQSFYQDINLPPASDLAQLIANGGKLTNGTSYTALLPYLGFNHITQARDAGKNVYNGLQADFHAQVKRDLSWQVAYTFSKAYDMTNLSANGGDLVNVDNPYNPFYSYGPSNFDRRHVFVSNFVYSLPFAKNSTGATKAIVGGWELAGVVAAQTGTPIQVTLGGTQGSNGLSQGTNRPNFTGFLDYPRTAASWFDPSNFSAPALGAWGNLLNNSVYGPGRFNWNLSLYKSFWFNEERGSKLEFRAECFNIWNHVQFQNVQGNFSANNFGAVTGPYDPRTLQLGLKLIF